MDRDKVSDLELVGHAVARDVGHDYLSQYIGELTTAVGVSRLLAQLLIGPDEEPRFSVDALDIAGGIGLSLAALAEMLIAKGGSVDHLDSLDINREATEAATELGERLGLPLSSYTANSLLQDPVANRQYDYVITAPPFGVQWPSWVGQVRNERDYLTPLPPTSDATLLFLQRTIRKMKPPELGGGRVAMLSGLKALTSQTEGETLVRQWLLHEELLEGVIYLPAGIHPVDRIATAVLVLSNTHDSGQVRFVNAMHLFESGADGERDLSPRNRLTSGHIETVANDYWNERDTRHAITIEAASLDRTAWNLVRRGIGGQDTTQTVSIPRKTSKESVLEDWPQADDAVDTQRQFIDLSMPSEIDQMRVAHYARMERVGSMPLLGLVMHAPSRTEPECGHQWIWFPATANGRVAVGDTSTKNGWYLCIDESRALPQYVALALGSPLGTEERHQYAARVIPNIRKSELLKIRVPMTDIAEQHVAVSLDRRIRTCELRLSELSARIWARPDRASKQVPEVDTMVPEDTVERWLEELPYPLATALWWAIAGGDAKAKHNQLLGFFEAVAEFTAVVHLSAQLDPLTDSPTERDDFLSNLHERRGIDLGHASFGDWIAIIETISKLVRKALEAQGDEAESERARLFEGYGTDTTYLDAISSKKLTRALRTAANLRNDRDGHTGRVTVGEAERWLDDLLANLTETRAIMGPIWRSRQLIRPISSVKRGSDWTHEVAVLTGAKLPFRKKKIHLAHSLDADELYLFQPGSRQALKLIPLIRMLSPEEPSETDCFFYSRLSSDGTLKYISYNAVSGSERFLPLTIPELDQLTSG